MAYIGCMTQQAMPVPYVPSKEEVCGECGVALWVSETMLAELPEGDNVFVCIPCLTSTWEFNEGNVQPIPSQRVLFEREGLDDDGIGQFLFKQALINKAREL